MMEYSDEEWDKEMVKPLQKRIADKLEALELYNDMVERAKKHTQNSDTQAKEALKCLDLFRDTKQTTLLKSVKFHRELAKAEKSEAYKCHFAAHEIKKQYDLSKQTQAGLKGIKKPSRSSIPAAGKKKGRARRVKSQAGEGSRPHKEKGASLVSIRRKPRIRIGRR